MRAKYPLRGGRCALLNCGGNCCPQVWQWWWWRIWWQKISWLLNQYYHFWLIPLPWDVCDDGDDEDDHVRTGNTLDHFSDIFSLSSLSKVSSQRIQNHLNLISSSFLVRNDNQSRHQRCGVGDATPSTAALLLSTMGDRCTQRQMVESKTKGKRQPRTKVQLCSCVWSTGDTGGAA